MTSEDLDILGIGVGPANLSLAALLDPIPHVRARFLEATPRFRWHPGLLLPDVTLQVSFLKDLVTLSSPTSEFSFLSFLHDTDRLYRFIVASAPKVTRAEFSQYYEWVAARLSTIAFAAAVTAVEFDGGSFVIHHQQGVDRARHLVLGTGLAANVPSFAVPFLGSTVFHAKDFLSTNPELRDKRVVVVGGGQTGAEVTLYLLSQGGAGPRRVSWVSARPGFLPIDDSPFTNELFFPDYVDYFRALPNDRRRRLLGQQALASDGAGEETLRAIYQRLYALDYIDDEGPSYRLLPGHTAVQLTSTPDGLLLTVKSAETDRPALIDADIVVLSTGYRYAVPDYLKPIRDRILWTDGWYVVRSDNSIAWEGPADRKIFVQNAARMHHGIADPNLSLLAWRSAVIVNALCGTEIYRTRARGTVVWAAWKERRERTRS